MKRLTRSELALALHYAAFLVDKGGKDPTGLRRGVREIMERAYAEGLVPRLHDPYDPDFVKCPCFATSLSGAHTTECPKKRSTPGAWLYGEEPAKPR